jgi:hypothetical protein
LLLPLLLLLLLLLLPPPPPLLLLLPMTESLPQRCRKRRAVPDTSRALAAAAGDA